MSIFNFRKYKILYKHSKKHIWNVGWRQKSDLRTHAWVEVEKEGKRYILDPMFRRIYVDPKDKYFSCSL